MKTLPKVFLIREDSSGRYQSPEDEVALAQEDLNHFLERPAMWVGRSNDFDSIIFLLVEKMSQIGRLCNSLGMRYFWDYCEFNAMGPHSMKFVGEWPNETLKTSEVLMADLRLHVGEFYKWIPDNLILAKKYIYLPQFDSLGFDHIPAGEVLSQVAEIRAFRDELNELLPGRKANMSHVFAEIGQVGGTKLHVKIVAINRPVDAKTQEARQARDLGFCD